MSDPRQEMREYNLDVELEDADAEVVSEALTANMAAIALIARLRENLDAEADARRACKAAVVHTIKGLVDGLPTSEVNYLQRLRELVKVEEQHKRCGNPVGHDLLHTALAQRDTALRERDEARAAFAKLRDDHDKIREVLG